MTKNELNDLYRYSLRLCNNEDEAFDLVQRSLEKLYQRSSEIDIQFPLRYVMRTIRNHFYNQIRDSKKITYDTVFIEQVSESLSFEENLVNKIDVENLLKNCSRLEREILFLWAYEGMSYQEISVFMKVPKGTLLTEIHKLKKRLRKMQEVQDESRF